MTPEQIEKELKKLRKQICCNTGGSSSLNQYQIGIGNASNQLSGSDAFTYDNTIAELHVIHTQGEFTFSAFSEASLFNIVNSYWDSRITLSDGEVFLTNAALRLGTESIEKGVIKFAGETTGLVTIQAAANAGTYTLTLPTSDGTSNQFLQTDGSGVLSWATVSAGDVFGPASATDNALAVFDTTTGKLLKNSTLSATTDKRLAFLDTTTFSGSAAGMIWKDSSSGLTFRGYGGSGFEFCVYDNVGNSIMATDAGTSNLAGTGKWGAGLLGFTLTAWMDVRGSTSAQSALRIRTGVDPSSPNDGDIWYDGTDLKMRQGGTTKTFTLV